MTYRCLTVTVAALLLISLMIGLVACAPLTNNDQTLNDTSSPSDSLSLNQETLTWLINENLNCMYNIFVLSSLTPSTMPVDVTQGPVAVDSEDFPDYAAFESYVRSVYRQETADCLLYNYPYEGVQKYLNVDGQLYVDLLYDGGKGYYVDWSDYTLDIDTPTDGTCRFVVHATIEEPAEFPVKEPYDIHGTAVFENNAWVLSEMLY